MKKDLYEILGVERTATTAEIKKAYKKLAQVYHPDMHANASDTEKAFYEEEFKKINNAHEILSNEEKRRVYDRDLEREETRTKTTANTSYSSSYSSDKTTKQKTTETRYQEPASDEDEWDCEPINLFDEFFEYLDKTKKEYTAAWQEIRKQEKKYPFKRRHQDISEDIEEEYKSENDSIISKIGHGIFSGAIHISLEFAYQLAKLRYIKTDNFPKFVIRNRKLLATTLASVIILTSAGSQAAEQKEQPTSEQTGIETQVDEDVNTIIIERKYVIDYGDTASELAEDANCTVNELCSRNGIKNSGFIYQGDKIVIPYCYNEEDIDYFTDVVECSENAHISNVAAEYDTTIESIRALNGDAIDEDGNIISSAILVPNFISRSELTEKKASEVHVYSKAQ